MYKFTCLDKTDCLQELAEFVVKQIVLDLKDNVTPIREGLLVESITGNCYQIQRTDFKHADDDQVVFWSLEFICIDVTDNGTRLPPLSPIGSRIIKTNPIS